MKIYTSIVTQWDGTKYVVIESDQFEYTGVVGLCCGATPDQDKIQKSQEQLMQTASQQATQIFGKDSSVFNDLVQIFLPTVQAGPGQNGYNAQQTSNLDSQAITANGQAARNAKQAAGESAAAAGGGNSILPSGLTSATDANIDTTIAANTANNLSNITQQGYQIGNQNYKEATQGLMASPSVFGTASTALSTAAGAGSDAGTTANQVATQGNSWMQAVSGALSGVAAAATPKA